MKEAMILEILFCFYLLYLYDVKVFNLITKDF